ncbi:hypothetical protein ASPZODRAFT_131709 [Penicilliopsis zonata CBS 506.65]|uniref:C3H1-type domain-containing protein n=1 Tax=Penicilliopsis zonata CBS 506.65 TaxID=1073090 RepID=A0A1L9SHX1_9EURO|nr:hypothetical protein ASPZODRAFT_131709 [Penicilliopsis zonata CBS 506.65]OJJ46820.1 hypothetical protein ASPZODRAFT_131709 [Penicilliopsis zonata CBS 506.65]
MIQAPAFQERFQQLKIFDNSKNEFIQELIMRHQDLENRYREAQLQLEREQRLSRSFQQDLKDREADIRVNNNNIAKMNFVSVLIDGDGVPFIDDLVSMGAEGGQEAARQLLASVSQYMEELEPSISNIHVSVHIYANIQGLGRAYRDAGILDAPAMLENFVRGFNMGNASCDFVDAGNGSQCADEKLRANFERAMVDLHCRHIIFGGSTDNGYARILVPCSDHDADKVTLLEGPPFARELKELASRFRHKSFPTLFRSAKIPNRGSLSPSKGPQPQLSPPRIPSTKSPPLSVASPPKVAVQPINYAGVAATSQASHIQVIYDLKTPASTAAKSRVARNAKGQRVDRPLTFNQTDYNNIKPQRYCNLYHINRSCPDESTCGHKHGPRLQGRQLEALKHLARTAPCRSGGLYCSDEECVYGHRCVLTRCERAKCRFSDEMHDVDSVIVG